MIRTWGFQTLNGNAQPLFGDKITAAFNALKAPNGLYVLTVANAALYVIGDRIILGVASGSTTNCLLVEKLDTTNNLVYCASEGDAPVSAWASNTQLMLDIACYGLVIQLASATTNPVYLGADSTVTKTGTGSAFYELLNIASMPPASFSLFKYDGQNPLRSSEIWFAGTSADKLTAAAFIN